MKHWPVVAYLAAVVAANLVVARFGPASTLLTAFLFIGLNLTLRDRIHDAWIRSGRIVPKMALLIAAGSVLSWLLNRSAGPVALASFVAFAAAETTDALIYQAVHRRPWVQRANISNSGSALVDSIVFPTLAFREFLPLIVLGNYVIKLGGGFAWSLVIGRIKEGRWDRRARTRASGTSGRSPRS